jgi:hypothetical protein
MNTRFTIAIIAAILIGSSACDESLSDIAGPSPNLTTTFSSIQEFIFESSDENGRVACIQCHTDVGRVPAAGMVLTRSAAYANLVGVASSGKPGETRVIPGDAENSYFIHKLEGRPGIAGQRMPRTNGPFLTDGQIMIIKRWIDEGAQNN